MALTVGVDVGGTKIAAGVVDEQGTLVATSRRESPASDSEAIEATIAEPVLEPSGLMRVPLRPRRKDVSLIDGSLFLQPSTGDPVRVLGRLAKSPSFWVSQVDVDWRYERIHQDAVLPVSLSSTARVKFFGPSTFTMTGMGPMYREGAIARIYPDP